MAQLVENKPPRRALIATLLHFDDPTRVVVLSDQRESKDLFWLHRRAHSLTFLIDRACQLEIDVTNLESARSIFLIVAESRFPLFAALTQLSAQQRSFSSATRIERNADSSQEIFFSGLEEERRAEDQRDCGELAEQQRGRCRRPLDAQIGRAHV